MTAPQPGRETGFTTIPLNGGKSGITAAREAAASAYHDKKDRSMTHTPSSRLNAKDAA